MPAQVGRRRRGPRQARLGVGSGGGGGEEYIVVDIIGARASNVGSRLPGTAWRWLLRRGRVRHMNGTAGKERAGLEDGEGATTPNGTEADRSTETAHRGLIGRRLLRREGVWRRSDVVSRSRRTASPDSRVRDCSACQLPESVESLR